MHSPQKCLFSALFCALLAFSGSAAFADCEANLSHGFAKVSAKLHRDGILTLADIKMVVDSDQPVNPLRYRTPGSRDTNAIQFFNHLLAQKSTTDAWTSIRAELRTLLVSEGVKAEEAKDAREDTAIILAQAPLSLPQVGDFYGTWQTNDGRVLYAFKVGNKIEVRDLSRRDWSWSSPKMDSWTLAGLSEDSDGKVRLNVVRSVSQGFLNRVAHNMKLRYQRDSWDIASGEDKVDTFYIRERLTDGTYFGSRGHVDAIATKQQVVFLNKETIALEDISLDGKIGIVQPDGTLVMSPQVVWESGESALSLYSFLRMSQDKVVDIRHSGAFAPHTYHNAIEYLFTRDGREIGVSQYNTDKTSHIVYVSNGVQQVITPPGKMVEKVKPWEAASGQVYVAAWTRERDVYTLQIYEPAVSLEKPVHELKIPPDFGWEMQMGFFEFRDRLYVVIAGRGAIAYIFEPAGGPTPVNHFYMGSTAGFKLVQSTNQVFLLPQGLGFAAFSLFNTSD